MNKYLVYLSSVFFFWNRTKQSHSYIYVNLFTSVFLSILYKIWHAIYTASYLVFYHPSSFFLSLLLSLLLSHWYYPFLLWKLVSFPPSIPPSLPSFFHFIIKWRLLFILHAMYGSCLPSLFFLTTLRWSITWLHYNLFRQSSVDGPLDCFLSFDVVDNTPMNKHNILFPICGGVPLE